MSSLSELPFSYRSEALSALNWEAARAVILDKGAIKLTIAEQLFS